MDIKTASRAYNRAEECRQDVLAEAMCELYQDMTGRPASDRLREALSEVLRFNS